ncbi:hypothetical protein M0P65_01230 [Candidatus Gracilibacteria bacterium]|nr:hypothetical protein [Candidatus Gracilibacteria bacterium]
MRKLNNKGETLVSLIIGIFIISLVITGIVSIIGSNYSLEDSFIKNNKVFFLKNNTVNIIKSIDTKSITEGEKIYIYKDKLNKKFEILTGTENDKYSLVDEYGNNILDTQNYDGNLYSRIVYIQNADTSVGTQNQIIKISVKEITKK